MFFSLVSFLSEICTQFTNSLHTTVNFNEVNSFSGSKVEMKEILYFQSSKIATDPSFGKYCSQGDLVKWCWFPKGQRNRQLYS